MSASAASFSGLVPLSTSVQNTPPSTLIPPQRKDAKPGEFEFSTILARVLRLRKAVRESARLHAVSNRGRLLMVTLTYSELDAWTPRDLSNCIKKMRLWAKDKGTTLRYCWVGELQQRGALHYHILIWLPWSVRLPHPDEAGWWPHGSTNVVLARSPIGYVTKYATKIRSKIEGEGSSFPKGARMHGAGGLESDEREQRAHHLAPSWVREKGHWAAKFRPAKGGGWVSKLTGEWFKSPWSIDSFYHVPGAGWFVRIAKRDSLEPLPLGV